MSSIVNIPACYSKKCSIDKNPIRQLLVRQHNAKVVQETDDCTKIRLEDGKQVRLITRNPKSDIPSGGRSLFHPKIKELISNQDLASARWVGNIQSSNPQDVINSYTEAFHYIEENQQRAVAGLRPPQIGALHAVLGYWTTAPSEPATVVMPTGTGKTETMLALFCSSKINKLLVLVPSNALRLQICEKFESLGILQEFEVVDKKCLRPIVGTISHAFSSRESAKEYSMQCNVMVSTPNALFAMKPEIRAALLGDCTHLFIDEAHHVAAETWRQLRDEFKRRYVVQFTATPFREDGRRIGGKLIYSFPLKEAQKQEYFSHINFFSIIDLINPDNAIAERCVEKLKSDLEAGFDHIIMARVSRIGRADDVLKIYQNIASEFNPVVLHSTYSVTKQREALEAIRSRTSRIIVCVNMLGEGFDLPALKIAAIHDAHKSLSVTLQFVGRFARTTGTQLGEASVVVSRPDSNFDPQLRQLYAEDADWNLIIRNLSESAIQVQQETSDFESAFGSLPDEVSMQSLLPKMSTVVFRTKQQEWNPQIVKELYGEDRLLTLPIAINQQDSVAWFVLENRTPVNWGDIRTVEEVNFDLFVLYWDKTRKLLYINSSNNDSVHEDLAKGVCGEGTERVTGENVYRVMSQIQRLVPTNIGLVDVRNRSRRFSMFVGADVKEAFPTVEAQTKTQTNIFAYGYEAGSRVSIGASLKGRIWSYRVASSIREWMGWCDGIGAKLLDEGISVDEVMQYFIRPVILDKRPDLVPIGLEWPFDVLTNTNDTFCVEYKDRSWPVVDLDFELKTHNRTDPIEFLVKSPYWSLQYRYEFENRGKIVAIGDDGIINTRVGKLGLEQFLNKHGLNIHFEKDALVIPQGLLLQPNRELPPYDSEKLIALDWTGVKLNVESQGAQRREDSVQFRMIAHVLSLREWDVVVDDDGSGEMADIVAIKEDGQDLFVHLTHCKYVSGGKPRAQVEDLYEVCGQAQKSTQWRRNVPKFLERLINRERNRVKNNNSGIMKGDARTLYSLLDKAYLLKPVFTIAIAQPGITKEKVSLQQLELLSSTETYVYETVNSELEIYCSP